jgi:hypothetical protein
MLSDFVGIVQKIRHLSLRNRASLPGLEGDCARRFTMCQTTRADSAFLRMEGQSLKQTRRLVARALWCACATAAHSSFNIAIGCHHAIEVFKHVPILICIRFVRESAMQLLVAVRNSAILGFDVIARMACVQGAIEIVSRLRQSLCIASDAVTPAVIALILDLRREVAARVIETRGGCPQ